MNTKRSTIYFSTFALLSGCALAKAPTSSRSDDQYAARRTQNCLEKRTNAGDPRAAFVLAKVNESAGQEAKKAELTRKSADMGYKPARYVIALRNHSAEDRCARLAAERELTSLAEEGYYDAAQTLVSISPDWKVASEWNTKLGKMIDVGKEEEAKRNALLAACESEEKWSGAEGEDKFALEESVLTRRPPLDRCLVYPVPVPKIPKFFGKPIKTTQPVLECLEERYRQGDPRGAFLLYESYYGAHDDEKGNEWLQRAADMQYQAAQYEMASNDLTTNLNNDWPKGVRELTELAESGYRPAAEELVFAYKHPAKYSDKENYDKLAEYWLKKAEPMTPVDESKEKKVRANILKWCKSQGMKR